MKEFNCTKSRIETISRNCCDHANKKDMIHGGNSRSSRTKVTIDPCICYGEVTYDLPVDFDFPDVHFVRFLRFPGNLCCSLNYLPGFQYLEK